MSQKPWSSNLSDLILLTSGLQLQLCSAGCLGLPEQQCVGLLQRPQHLLNAQQQIHNLIPAMNCAYLLIKLEPRLEYLRMNTSLSQVTSSHSYQLFCVNTRKVAFSSMKVFIILVSFTSKSNIEDRQLETFVKTSELKSSIFY